MTDEKIVRLPGTEDLPENPITIADDRRFWCSHESINLDDHSRTVNCTKCGKVLDPFNFLMENARTLQMAWRNHAEAKRQAGELVGRIGALKKEEQRLRAQVKRLQEKATVVSVRGKDKL